MTYEFEWSMPVGRQLRAFPGLEPWRNDRALLVVLWIAVSPTGSMCATSE